MPNTGTHTSLSQMAVGQNQWYHFGVGAPPILDCFSGDWNVHGGYDLDFDPWPNGQSMRVATSRETSPHGWASGPAPR